MQTIVALNISNKFYANCHISSRIKINWWNTRPPASIDLLIWRRTDQKVHLVILCRLKLIESNNFMVIFNCDKVFRVENCWLSSFVSQVLNHQNNNIRKSVHGLFHSWNYLRHVTSVNNYIGSVLLNRKHCPRVIIREQIWRFVTFQQSFS